MDKLNNTIAALESPMPTEEEMPSPMEGPAPTEELDPEGVTKIIEDHLDQLPDDDKEFLASHLSKEMAKVVGLVTGSTELEDYLNTIVNPDIALIPIPRDKAQAMLKKYQEMNMTNPTQPEATQPPAQSQAPVGAMAPNAGPPGTMPPM